MHDLFSRPEAGQPLAARMRPATLEQYAGQEHLLAPGSALRKSLEAGHIHSMILWGPPGVGKTTLALLMARYIDAHFMTLSAVLSGIKEIRAAIDEARYQKQLGRTTVLFVDEVHRFNKAQQDAFLPHIEEGTIVFIGATTENPSFELNAALLSRARVHVLKAISRETVQQCLTAALSDKRGFADHKIQASEAVLSTMADVAQGDLRRAYNLLEVSVALADSSRQGDAAIVIDDAILREAAGSRLARFDKGGEVFYDQISALHKSVRGSQPDAALYWLVCMIEGGCDPLYVARRVVRMATEDIGNADPRALTLALNAWDVVERLGQEEGVLALAQAVTYLASAAKSNAVYAAFNEVRQLVRQQGSGDVPVHLRNAPTKLLKELGHGAEYRYAHDYPDAYAAGERYLPVNVQESRWYKPVRRGLEIRIAEKLDHLRELDRQSTWQRGQVEP